MPFNMVMQLRFPALETRIVRRAQGLDAVIPAHGSHLLQKRFWQTCSVLLASVLWAQSALAWNAPPPWGGMPQSDYRDEVAPVPGPWRSGRGMESFSQGRQNPWRQGGYRNGYLEWPGQQPAEIPPQFVHSEPETGQNVFGPMAPPPSAEEQLRRENVFGQPLTWQPPPRAYTNPVGHGDWTRANPRPWSQDRDWGRAVWPDNGRPDWQHRFQTPTPEPQVSRDSNSRPEQPVFRGDPQRSTNLWSRDNLSNGPAWPGR